MATPARQRNAMRHRHALRVLGGVATLLVAAGLSAVAPTSDPASAAVRTTRADAAQRPVAPTVTANGSTSASTTASPTVPVNGDNPPSATRANTTMSMDDPIQGGLTAHQAQARSAALLTAHKDVVAAKPGTSWTPAMGRTALARAQSWLGMPYSWAGGTATGPTPGRCDPGSGADLDCHIVGFDCSGLMMYAWGPYAALPHYAQTQRESGKFHPGINQLLPGDMVFFSGYLAGGIGHVAIYEGKGMVIEAPQSGDVVRRSKLADLIAHDGTYRGATRPLTAATPVLAAPKASVATTGGTVTVRGTHLAGVTSVVVGDTTVRRFVAKTDTAITFRAPAHAADMLAMTARTGWGATSKPVALRYAKPHAAPTSTSAPAPVTTAPSAPTSTPPATTPPPTKTPPTSTAPTKAPPTKTPPTSPASPTSSPTTSSTPPPASSDTAGP